MLKKLFRLPIQNWMKDKKIRTTTIRGDFFIARVRENGENRSRFGILINAKVFGSAVKRNRLRRKIFEAIRATGLVENFFGKDVLLSVLPQAVKSEEEKIIESLILVLKKIK